MVRYRLSELIAEKKFRDGKRVTLEQISKATGVHRATLSKLINQRDTNTTVEVLEKLCIYFGVQLGDLVELVPDKRQSGKNG